MMEYKAKRTSLLVLVLATLCVSVFPSVQATDHTERGYEETEVWLNYVNATASGPQNHNLDVADRDNVIVNVTCNYTDNRGQGVDSNPAFHYYNLTVTYQSNTQYDDENVTTYQQSDSGQTFLEVSFEVSENTTLYVYEYVSVTLIGFYEDFDEAWYNWTVTLTRWGGADIPSELSSSMHRGCLRIKDSFRDSNSEIATLTHRNDGHSSKGKREEIQIPWRLREEPYSL